MQEKTFLFTIVSNDNQPAFRTETVQACTMRAACVQMIQRINPYHEQIITFQEVEER